jgi:hypothetical protein
MVFPALPRREEWRWVLLRILLICKMEHPALPRRENVPAGHPGKIARIDGVPGIAAS